MKRRAALACLLLISALLTVAVACGSNDDTGPTKVVFSFGLDAQTIATGSDGVVVRAIEFAPDGRMFYAQQYTDDRAAASIRVVNADGTLQAAPFATVQIANYLDLDWGLTGLALDPDFATNNFVYAFYTSPVSENIGKPTIVRYTDTNGQGTDQRVLTDDFPETFPNHQGYNANGELHFGPDGFLYASLGDYDIYGDQPDLILDHSSPIGKILRLDPETGEAAVGNPFEDEADADARVYASGFREPFSFTFDPTDGTLYAADNTTVSCEELNVIEAGEEYGWSTMGDFPFSDCSAGTGTKPIAGLSRENTMPQDFLSFVEVQGMSTLEGSKYVQLTDGLILCESQKSLVNMVPSAGALVRLVITSGAVTATDIIVRDCKGTAVAHEGEIYYSNANTLFKLVEASAVGSGGAPSQAPPP